MVIVSEDQPRHRRATKAAAPWPVVRIDALNGSAADNVQDSRGRATEPPRLVRDLQDFLGGPRGRFAAAGQRSWWTPSRMLLVSSLVFLACGFLTKANCIQGVVGEGGVVQLNWGGNRQFTSACYTDIVPLYEPQGGLIHYLNFPPLSALLLWGMSGLTRVLYPLVSAIPGTPALPESGLFFIIVALFLAATWVLCVRMLDSVLPDVSVTGYLLAASPLVAVHAFTNIDLVAVAASIGVVWAVQRRSFLLAGVLLGCGVALKLWPALLLIPLLILALRDRRRIPEFVVMLLGAVGTWLVINVPFIVAMPQDWLRFYQLVGARTSEWASTYAVVGRLTQGTPWGAVLNDPTVLNVTNLVVFVAVCVVLVVFGLRVATAPTAQEPTLVELSLLTLGAFLLVNKIWSPQYSLWLVPFAVLVFAPHRWRYWYLLAGWALVEVGVWLLVMWHMLGEDNLGIPHQMLDMALVGRCIMLCVMLATCVKMIRGRVGDRA